MNQKEPAKFLSPLLVAVLISLLFFLCGLAAAVQLVNPFNGNVTQTWVLVISFFLVGLLPPAIVILNSQKP